MGAVREYGKMLERGSRRSRRSPIYGTAMVGDFTNTIGGIPTRNFSSGRTGRSAPRKARSSWAANIIYERNTGARRGNHPCLHAGLHDQVQQQSTPMKTATRSVSPLEYETLGLMGTNCGLKRSRTMSPG